MEFGGGGGITAKRSHSGGEDRLSALPDDALVLILLCLDTASAGRTSVLSRRWRPVWTLLPVLRFPDGADPHRVREALTAHQAAIRYLRVRAVEAVPESVAAWLSAASRRLTGRLVFQNKAVPTTGDFDGELKSFELPCLENTTSIPLDLWFLMLALPPAGTFARLTELILMKALFHEPSALGDLVSSPRCPSLQKLIVHDAYGLVNLAIHSKSLLQVELRYLYELQQLIIDAPALKELKLHNNCLAQNQHSAAADLSAPQLVSLELSDPYLPSSIQLGNMELLQRLTCFFLVYGPEGIPSNHTMLELLTRFQGIQDLTLNLAFPQVIGNDQYLMEDITMIPRISFLTLVVKNYGHAFGASLFHVLKNCTGLRSLSLHFDGILMEQCTCPSGCICDQPINWKTDKLLLSCLQEVEITNMSGADHEVDFLKQLLNWATALKNMRMVFHCWVSESRARELRQALSIFFGPEMCTKFYIHGDDPKLLSVLR